MTFETSDDIPFSLRGGDDPKTHTFNRAAALNRINNLIRKQLPDFDIRTKSADFLLCLDLEMYKKYYAGESKDKKIDEEFCQLAAKTCLEMNGIQTEVKDEPNIPAETDVGTPARSEPSEDQN